MYARRVACLVALSLAVGLSEAEAVPSIQNGSFEDVQISAPFFSRNASDVPGWTATVSGASNEVLLWAIGYTDSAGSITAAGQGNQFVTLRGANETWNWTSQITGLTIGQTYTLSFMIANQGSDSPAVSMTAGFDSGSSTAPSTFTAPANGLPYYEKLWLPESLNFVATATSATVDFSRSNQLYDLGLDNVQVQAADVSAAPEPSTILLLGTGLVGLGGMTWRRARKK